MIKYFVEDTRFNFTKKRLNSKWLKAVAENEDKKIGDISVIFCSDSYLLDINKRFLQHDYYTDIITFDYCEGKILSGDLFISVDSVRANSEYYKTDFEEELNRVIVHGVLHLIGFDDHKDDDIKMMRSKESDCLDLRKKISE